MKGFETKLSLSYFFENNIVTYCDTRFMSNCAEASDSADSTRHESWAKFTCAGLPQSGKNIWKMKFFQVREKSGNFVDGQGNLERTLKIREKSQGI